MISYDYWCCLSAAVTDAVMLMSVDIQVWAAGSESISGSQTARIPCKHVYLVSQVQLYLGRLLPPRRTNKALCTSVHKKFFDLNEIWCVGRGRWMIHDGMPYDLIQGQGHSGLKCAKMADFKGYLHQYACNQTTISELWCTKTINSKF